MPMSLLCGETIDGADPPSDESLIYERILREDCDIKTRIELYPGLPHGFWLWFPNAGWRHNNSN